MYFCWIWFWHVTQILQFGVLIFDFSDISSNSVCIACLSSGVAYSGSGFGAMFICFENIEIWGLFDTIILCHVDFDFSLLCALFWRNSCKKLCFFFFWVCFVFVMSEKACLKSHFLSDSWSFVQTKILLRFPFMIF